MPLGVEATSFSVSQIPKGSDGWPTMYLLESPPNPQHTAHVSCITLIGCMLSLVSYWERCRTYGRILVSYHQRGMISSNFFFRKSLFQFTLYYFFCFYSTILFVVSFFFLLSLNTFISLSLHFTPEWFRWSNVVYWSRVQDAPHLMGSSMPCRSVPTRIVLP